MASTAAAGTASMSNGAGSSRAGPSRSSAHDELSKDKRGYPERQFQTQILPIRSDAIRFSGKGKEPMRGVHIVFEQASNNARDEEHLDAACQALQASHLVAFPTETVYGLGGNALDADAVGKIFAAKGRPADNPLIVHIADMDMLDELMAPGYYLSPAYKALADAFWPGPLTLLVPANKARVPSVVRCGLDSLGVRMPAHPVARALIARSRLPLAAPSANVSGRPSPTTAMHVYNDMTKDEREASADGTYSNGAQGQGRIPYVIDGGPSLVGLESTVVDGITAPGELRVLRPGGVSVEDIEYRLQEAGLLLAESHDKPSPKHVRVRVYGKDMAKDNTIESNPTTPGMKYRHYSPDAEVVLLVTSSKTSGTDALPDAQDAVTAIYEQVALTRTRRGGRPINAGLMSMDDSPLTAKLLQGSQRRSGDTRFWTPVDRFEEGDDRGKAFTLRGFSLGTTATPSEAAHRLFDGLRSLDEHVVPVPTTDEIQATSDGRSRCDVIFVEAPNDDAGVGLAIMNRIQKAASRTLLVAV